MIKIGLSSALCSDINKSSKKVKIQDDAGIGYVEYHNYIEKFEIVDNPTHCYAI